VKSVIKPRKQSGFRAGEVDVRHSDLGESEIARPLAHLLQQHRTFEVNALGRHPPIVGTASRPLRWAGEEDTRAFAERLAAHPAIADAFIALHGDLGAGKTTLVRHLLRALGAEGRIKSPTYAVVEPYELPAHPAWHFDFYRFDDPREWEDAGFRDIFAGPGLKLAEWPEKAAGLLPAPDLDIHIALDQDDQRRRVTVRANTPRGEELLS
jgi:tRNA threonylcarbamoyladenosine biosynthesis protein TsaE